MLDVSWALEGFAIWVPTTGQGGGWLTGSRVPQDGNTPLQLAVETGHEVVVALLAVGVDKDAKDEVRGV